MLQKTSAFFGLQFEVDFGSQQASGDEDQDDLSNSKTFERLVQLSELEEEVSYAGARFLPLLRIVDLLVVGDRLRSFLMSLGNYRSWYYINGWRKNLSYAQCWKLHWSMLQEL